MRRSRLERSSAPRARDAVEGEAANWSESWAILPRRAGRFACVKDRKEVCGPTSRASAHDSEHFGEDYDAREGARRQSESSRRRRRLSQGECQLTLSSVRTGEPRDAPV